MSTYTTLQKYLFGALVFSLIVAVTIKYVPYFKMEDDKMLRTVILSYIGFLCVAFIANKVFSRTEKMSGDVTMNINYNKTFPPFDGDFDNFPNYSEYPEMKRGVYPVIRREMLHPEAQPEIHPELHQESMPGIQPEIHPEINPEVHHESRPEGESKGAKPSACSSCDSKTYMPQAFSLTRWDGDLANTGLQYDNDSADSPYNAFMNNQFEGSNIPFSIVREIIDKQRYNAPDYHYHSEGVFQIKDTPYTSGIPYKDAPSVICKSKLNDLYNQHNHYIQASPHTHYGKSRGYMNWDKA